MAGRPAKSYPVGTVLEKNYKGKNIRVKVQKDGFALKIDGKLHPKTFDSLSAAVMKVTGGKKYPASVFFGSSGTGKRGRKPKDNGAEVETGVVSNNSNITDVIQSTIERVVERKVEELFRS